jgi:uncharacterized coiled-coil DUF342 family protein
MPAGAVDLGGSAQAASVGYPVGAIHFGPAWEDDSVQLTHKGWSQITDGMAKSIVRLECEADELRAEVAMLKQGMVMLAEERDEAREKAERYRLEANAMMAKLHELQAYADKLADGLPAGMLPRDVENLREANAGLAEDLQKAEQERDEARMQYRTIELLGMALVKTIDQLKAEKAAIFSQLISLQAGSRRATLDEIAESVREKYQPEHEGEGMEND